MTEQISPKGINTISIIAIETCLTVLDTDRIQDWVQIRMIHEDNNKTALEDRASNARCRYTC
jgi:hypothetical protein